VRRILEVVAPESPINRGLSGRGVLGTIAVDGQAIEVIDVRATIPDAADLEMRQVPA
jgi:hypothetical protein